MFEDKNFKFKLSGIVSEINTDQGYMKVRINSDYKYYNFDHSSFILDKNFTLTDYLMTTLAAEPSELRRI